MKTMKKTCTTFLLAFVMLLACLFPAFAVKDTKKASALDFGDCETLYHFSDSLIRLYDEASIAEDFDSYYIKSFNNYVYHQLLAETSFDAFLSSSNYHEFIQSEDYTSGTTYNAYLFEFIVKRPNLAYLNQLFSAIENSSNGCYIGIISTFPSTYYATLTQYIDCFVYSDVLEGFGEAVAQKVLIEHGQTTEYSFMLDSRLINLDTVQYDTGYTAIYNNCAFLQKFVGGVSNQAEGYFDISNVPLHIIGEQLSNIFAFGENAHGVSFNNIEDFFIGNYSPLFFAGFWGLESSVYNALRVLKSTYGEDVKISCYQVDPFEETEDGLVVSLYTKYDVCDNADLQEEIGLALRLGNGLGLC